MPEKAERKTGMGLVTDVSDVQSHEDSGREFIVVHVGGDKDQHKFSCWKPELFSEFRQGTSVQFKYTQKGKWRNIVEVESDTDGDSRGVGKAGLLSKDELIVRQSSVATASRVVNTLEDDYEKATQVILTMAEAFEGWVWRKKTTEPEPPEEE